MSPLFVGLLLAALLIVLVLSALSLAPVGSDMGQAPARSAGPAPDISHLRLETP